MSAVFPKDSHDWMEISKIFTPKKDVARMTLYICNYNESGQAYWDDLEIIYGNTDLTYEAKMPDIKQVRLYSKEKGLINKTEDFPKGKNDYKNTVSVGVWGTYCVEAEDYSGKIIRQWYPEKNKKEITATATTVPVFKRFEEEIVKPKESVTANFEFPELKGKKLILEFQARLDRERKISGWCTEALQLTLNGKKVDKKLFVGRKQTFMRSDGVVANVFGHKRLSIFYSPGFHSLSEDNPYCPVDAPERNPFMFKFNVSSLVKKGENSLTMLNKHDARKLVVKNCRIVTK